MSDFRPDFTTLRPFPHAGTPARLRRSQSHTPASFAANQRATTYYNTVYSSKNRPKDGLLPSPRIDFNRMYNPTAIRLPVSSCDLDRSRSPSPAPQIHFTPLSHPHDLSLPIK